MKIIGSSLAAAVAAYELNQRHRLHAWAKTSPHIGGHFGGFQFQEAHFDIGMVAIEPYELDQKAIPYIDSPPLGRDGVLFTKNAISWLESQFQLSTLDVVSIFRGIEYPDFLIADNLEVLSGLSQSEKRIIQDQISTNISGPLGSKENKHPKNKGGSEYFKDSSLQKVFAETVGETFSSLLLTPFLNKISPRIQKEVSGLNHRAVWVPLYYPETIFNHLAGYGVEKFLPKPFLVPKGRTIAGIVSELTSRINTLLVQEKQDINDTGETIFLGNFKELAELGFSASETPPRYEFGISVVTLVCAGSGLDKVWNLIDTSFESFRISCRSVKSGEAETLQISVEFGELFTSVDEERLIDIATAEVNELLPNHDLRFVKLVRARVKIVEDAVARLSKGQGFLSSTGTKGFVIDSGSSSMNDQINLALWSINVQK